MICEESCSKRSEYECSPEEAPGYDSSRTTRPGLEQRTPAVPDRQLQRWRPVNRILLETSFFVASFGISREIPSIPAEACICLSLCYSWTDNARNVEIYRIGRYELGTSGSRIDQCQNRIVVETLVASRSHEVRLRNAYVTREGLGQMTDFDEISLQYNNFPELQSNRWNLAKSWTPSFKFPRHNKIRPTRSDSAMTKRI